MKPRHLTIDQAQRLRDLVAKRLRFFGRLVDRMNAVGFVPDDPLMHAAICARDAVHKLHVEAHYAGCKSGVGRE
ncbi:MAG TPA: hypothetical protein VIM11_24720 [Tepidisphaeraceae bacterium]|jgi:hypothetical protein